MRFPLQVEYTVSGMLEMKVTFNLFEFGNYTLSYHGVEQGSFMCHLHFINISTRVITIIDVYHVIHTCDPLHRMRRKTSHLVLIFLYFCSYTCMCAWVDVHVCGGQRLTLGSSSIELHLFIKTEALTEPECNNLARSSCLHKCWACRHVLPCLAF